MTAANSSSTIVSKSLVCMAAIGTMGYVSSFGLHILECLWCDVVVRMKEKVEEMYGKMDKLCDKLNLLQNNTLLDGFTKKQETQGP